MKEKINILHSFPVWLPQTQTWMYNQVKFLPDTTNNHIVCEQTTNLEQFNVPNIHSLSAQPVLRRMYDIGLRQLKLRNHTGFLVNMCLKYHGDILHSHFGSIGWADIYAAKKAGIKHVVTFYGQEITRFPRQDARWYKHYKQLFAHIDRVLCEGPFMRKSIIELGCPPEKALVQHLGVEVDKIDFKPRVWEKGSPLKVLIAASFREKKGIPYAIEALGSIDKDIPLEITIIGDAGDDASENDEKNKIQKFIKNYQLTDKVRLLGFQPYDVLFKEAYNHHIFLSPSVTASDGDTEGGAPVTLIDMIATGMPIISTQHCDIPNVIDHKKTGLLAKERDPEGLKTHLLWLINHSEKWEEMVTAGRDKMEQDFNANVQGNKLANIYQNCID